MQPLVYFRVLTARGQAEGREKSFVFNITVISNSQANRGPTYFWFSTELYLWRAKQILTKQK
jgi:hypothetical protein